MRTSLRSVVAPAAAAIVLLYGAGGHGLPQLDGYEGMAGPAVGLCLLLATFVVGVAIPRPGAPPGAVPAFWPSTAPSYRAPTPVDGRARASPRRLQRFRN